MKKLFFYFLFFSISLNVISQTGLRGDYYDGQNFDKYIGTMAAEKIDFYWDRKPPIEGMNPHVCSVRWTGRIKSPQTGTYTFSARVDDGIRVWVGGVQVINNWQLNDVGYSKGRVKMKADQFYRIKIEYFNALNEAEIKLLWELPEPEEKGWFASLFDDEEGEIVPADVFYQPKGKKLKPTWEQLPPKPEAKKPPPPIEEKPKPKTKPEPAVVQKPKPTPPPPTIVDKRVIDQYIPKNVQFGQAKAEILEVSFPELDKLAKFLKQHTYYKVRIEGHTDNVGDAEKNFQLSHKRANSVAAYLVKKDIDPKRLKPQGFGGSKPLVQSDGRKYHPENRRVEFILE